MTIPIVIVDDEMADRYLMKRLVKESGIDAKCVEFKAGDEFLAAISDHKERTEKIGKIPPAPLVLLDIRMPRLTGFDVLQAIQYSRTSHVADPPSMVIVMFSSSAHPEDRATALSYDFVKDYVVKPLTQDKLHELVAKHYH